MWCDARRLQKLTRQCLTRAVVKAPVFPPSSTVQKCDGYTLRLYEPHVVVEVGYQARADGYDALAAYFDGANAESLKFVESQPVVLNYFPDGTKKMQLYIGPTRDGRLVDPPQPSLPGSVLAPAGGELCAVLRFEGYITPESAANAVASLKEAVARDHLKLAATDAAGVFRICQYGPIFSFSGRENEVLLRLQL